MDSPGNKPSTSESKKTLANRADRETTNELFRWFHTNYNVPLGRGARPGVSMLPAIIKLVEHLDPEGTHRAPQVSKPPPSLPTPSKRAVSESDSDSDSAPVPKHLAKIRKPDPAETKRRNAAESSSEDDDDDVPLSQWHSQPASTIFPSPAEKPAPEFKCLYPECTAVLSSDEERKAHLRTHDFKCMRPDCSCPDRVWPTITALKTHHQVHDKPFVCQECGEGFSTNQRLTTHMGSRHHDGVTFFVCDGTQAGCSCGKKFKTKETLCDHVKLARTSKDIKCTFPCCKYMAKRNNEMSIHMKQFHRIYGEPFQCELCDYKTGYKTQLNAHMLSHDPKKQHECTWARCFQRFKTKQSLALHMKKHEESYSHACRHCPKQFVDVRGRNSHEQLVHGVGLVMKCCTHCPSSFKTNSSLREHMAVVHSVGGGHHQCAACNQVFPTGRALGDHMRSAAGCTDEYARSKKIQEENVCKALLGDGWEQIPTQCDMPLPGQFKREHQIDFQCAGASADRSFARIDFVLGYDGGFIFLEVDEHQHKYGMYQGDTAAISCDAKRMANVMCSLTVECSAANTDLPSIYWLRYNPHAWHVDGVTTRVDKFKREERLLRFLKEYAPEDPLGIGYAFYDHDKDTGLDVLNADEFPPEHADITYNLDDLSAGIGFKGLQLDTSMTCMECDD